MFVKEKITEVMFEAEKLEASNIYKNSVLSLLSTKFLRNLHCEPLVLDPASWTVQSCNSNPRTPHVRRHSFTHRKEHEYLEIFRFKHAFKHIHF